MQTDACKNTIQNLIFTLSPLTKKKKKTLQKTAHLALISEHKKYINVGETKEQLLKPYS